MYDEAYFQAIVDEAHQVVTSSYQLDNQDEMSTTIGLYKPAYKAHHHAAQKVQLYEKYKKTEEEKKAAAIDEKKEATNFAEATEQVVSMLRNLLEKGKGTRLEEQSEEVLTQLMKGAIVQEATPEGMADFCSEESGNGALVDELLNSFDMMKEMWLNGGAKYGHWGRAYQIYKQISAVIEDDDPFSDCHTKLALGIALEHANPIIIFDTTHDKSDGIPVDPVQRFLHYVEAHQNGDLDPAFPYFSAWEYRHATNSDATEEQLAWGREHLRRYRPDQVTMDDMHWRYCTAVQSDIGYRQAHWPSRPKTYQMLVSGGGKCGPRAWYGRFITKAFGLPTWGLKQPGHASMGRWTPKGWETVLGADFIWANWEHRPAVTFQQEAHARALKRDDEEEYFNKVTLLECMAHLHKEDYERGFKDLYLPKQFWFSVANGQRLFWHEQVKEHHFKREASPDDDTCLSCKITEYKARKDKPQQDKEVKVLGDGSISIPAGATSKMDQAKLINCFEGGSQMQLNRDKKSEVSFTLPASVTKQKYQVSCKICTVHAHHEKESFHFDVNGSQKKSINLPYTVGEWQYTDAVQLEMGSGDTLKIVRDGDQLWGIALKEIKLVPM